MPVISRSIVAFLLLLFTNVSIAQVPELPREGLRDIAVATFDPGPVIYYNPSLCAQVGPYVSEFYRQHEQAHHYLGHVQALMFEDPYTRVALSVVREREADIAATKATISNPLVVDAAIKHFYSAGNYTDGHHPPAIERARCIQATANQLRPDIFPPPSF